MNEPSYLSISPKDDIAANIIITKEHLPAITLLKNIEEQLRDQSDGAMVYLHKANLRYFKLLEESLK